MTASLRDVFGDLDRAQIAQRRAELEALMASVRAGMGSPVVTWPAEIREEYGDMAQTWMWLGLYQDELDELPARADSGA